jgi:excisionase family DNA binding protein
LTVEEVSDRLRVEPKTVRRWARSNKLPAYKAGREWRVDAGELELLLRIRGK